MDPSLYEAATSGDVTYFFRTDVSKDVLELQRAPKGNNMLHIEAEYKQLDFFEHVPAQFSLFWTANNEGDTPLHVAAKVGCAEVVEFLIRHTNMPHNKSGADDKANKELLRMPNFDMDTALHIATRNGHGRVVILLMEADPELCTLTNSANESPLFLAVSNDFPRITLYMLIKSPIVLSFQGINGVTALHSMVTRRTKGAEGIVRLMVSKFTMPGGFKSDGVPVLNKNIYFQLFQLFNLTTFLFSTLAIYIELVATAILKVIAIPSSLIQYCIGGLVVAFAFGTLAAMPSGFRITPRLILLTVVCLFVMTVACVTTIKYFWQVRKGRRIFQFRNCNL